MSETDASTTTDLRLKTPSMWRVLLHNDDFTPMDFVVAILIRIFGKDPDEAARLMMMVHEKGRAQVGVFTKEIAETKALQVRATAERYQHPLIATAEEA